MPLPERRYGPGPWNVVRRVVDAAPELTHVEVGADGESIALHVESLGSVIVSEAGAEIAGCDDDAIDVLEAFGEPWAWGQWLALHGTFAFHGSVVERDGEALVLIGVPRAGTSLTGFALTNMGWRLISDGVCPLQMEEGKLIAIPGPPEFELDATVTASFPPKNGFMDAGTPRGRSRVPAESAPTTPVAHIVEIIPTSLRTDGVLLSANDDDVPATDRLLRNAVAGLALQHANPRLHQELQTFCSNAVHSAASGVALVPFGRIDRPYSPRQIASLISDSLSTLDSGVTT